MALDIQGLADCFIFLFDNLRKGACLPDRDCNTWTSLFMLLLTSSTTSLLKSIHSRSSPSKVRVISEVFLVTLNVIGSLR